MPHRPTLDEVRAAPKVLLHDHLDGGVRPQTVLDLAAEQGYDKLPTTDPGELAQWFVEGAARRSLEKYLAPFEHTVGVMQTREALFRVAAECAEDLDDDGVVYAEIRFAPELHLEQGLEPDEVVESVLAGFESVTSQRRIAIGLLLTAMRTAANSSDIAQLALRHRDRGVVGFDIAGSEAGHPPTRHLDAFRTIAEGNHHITIHAGEAFGLPSIWEAIQICGAERLGHGVRIVDDIQVADDGSVKLGELASFVRDRRVPLEMCPTSNVHTGVVDDLADHPIGLLTRLRFRVTVNTDNRLMSDITMSREMHGLTETFGYGWSELEWFTVNAMKSAFWPFDKRLRLINEIIKPGYAAMKARAIESA